MTVNHVMAYAFAYKYDNTVGAKLFKAMTATIERIGDIGGQESMLDVGNAVEGAAKTDLIEAASSNPLQLCASL